MASSDPRRPDPAPPPEAALPRAIGARVHARMLLALREGWPPLPAEEAWDQLDAMVARFGEGPAQLFADPLARGFYAALNDDPDLAESFALLAEDAVAPAVAVPAGLAARVAAIGREGRVTPAAAARAAPRPTITFLGAYARTLGEALAEVRDRLLDWHPGAALPNPAFGVVRTRREDRGAPPAPPPVAPIVVTAEDAERGVLLTLAAAPDPAGTFALTVQVEPIAPPNPAAAPAAWAVAVDLPGRALAVEPAGFDTWRVREPLTAADLAVVAVRVEEAPAGPR